MPLQYISKAWTRCTGTAWEKINGLQKDLCANIPLMLLKSSQIVASLSVQWEWSRADMNQVTVLPVRACSTTAVYASARYCIVSIRVHERTATFWITQTPHPQKDYVTPQSAKCSQGIGWLSPTLPATLWATWGNNRSGRGKPSQEFHFTSALSHFLPNRNLSNVLRAPPGRGKLPHFTCNNPF